jgi:hypothetical protein
MLDTGICDYLVSLGASVTVLDDSERHRLEQEWLESFCVNVKEQTGKWVYRGYRWHAFSYGYASAKTGVEALEYYKALRPKRFYVFSDWGPEIGLACEGIEPPDLTELGTDLYAFPKSLLWTMFFTHEQPSLGPYFACRDWKTLKRKIAASG